MKKLILNQRDLLYPGSNLDGFFWVVFREEFRYAICFENSTPIFLEIDLNVHAHYFPQKFMQKKRKKIPTFFMKEL